MNGDNLWRVEKYLVYNAMPFLNEIFYFCVTGLHSDSGVSISSTTNWNKSQSNCKTQNYMENHATDMCKLNKDTTTETGMWTNIFRVEISSHVDHGNSIHIFI
jgi:hypothetical protein